MVWWMFGFVLKSAWFSTGLSSPRSKLVSKFSMLEYLHFIFWHFCNLFWDCWSQIEFRDSSFLNLNDRSYNIGRMQQDIPAGGKNVNNNFSRRKWDLNYLYFTWWVLIFMQFSYKDSKANNEKSNQYKKEKCLKDIGMIFVVVKCKITEKGLKNVSA